MLDTKEIKADPASTTPVNSSQARLTREPVHYYGHNTGRPALRTSFYAKEGFLFAALLGLAVAVIALLR